MEPEQDYSVRTRAAFCHLCALTVIGAIWIPFLVSRTAHSSDRFTRAHGQGAAVYQLSGLLVFGLAFLFRSLPAQVLGLGAVGSEALAGLFWVLYLCGAVLYLCGVLGLAVQAIGGTEFNFLGYQPDLTD